MKMWWDSKNDIYWNRLRIEQGVIAEVYGRDPEPSVSDIYREGSAYIYPEPGRGHIIRYEVQYDSLEEGIEDLEKICKEMWPEYA